MYSLLVTSFPIKSSKALANTSRVVTYPPPTAIAALITAISVEGIVQGGTLLLAAIRPPPACVAQTSHRLHRVPRSDVHAIRSLREIFLRKTFSSVIAILQSNNCITTRGGLDVDLPLHLDNRFSDKTGRYTPQSTHNPCKIPVRNNVRPWRCSIFRIIKGKRTQWIDHRFPCWSIPPMDVRH